MHRTLRTIRKEASMTQPADPLFREPQQESGEPREDVEHEGESEGDLATHHAESAEHAPPYDDDASEPLEEADAESVRPPPERIDD
jgi:hypothetical protein